MWYPNIVQVDIDGKISEGIIHFAESSSQSLLLTEYFLQNLHMV